MPIFLLALLGSKWTWIAVAGAIVVSAAALYVHGVYNEGVTQGTTQTQIVVQEHTIKTQRKMDNAEAHGPRTQSDAVKRLRDGSF